MKITSFSRTLLLSSILCAAGLGAAYAQDAGAPGGGHHANGLTPEENQQLKSDRDKALAADPDLKKEDDDLMAKRADMSTMSADDKKAFHQQMHEHQMKMRDAVEKLDPAAKPLYDKMMAARHPQGGGGQ